MDEEAILDNLAPTLRRDVQAHLLSRTVARLPLFQRLSLSLQLEVHAKLKPVLREASEAVVDSLTKGSRGGASIFFLRRGIVSAKAALADELPLFDLDAGTASGGGCILGEHALMAKSQCICTYGAATRCELFALGVEELLGITQAGGVLMPEEVDTLAREIYADFARRHILRAVSLSLRLAQLSAGATAAAAGPAAGAAGAGAAGGAAGAAAASGRGVPSIGGPLGLLGAKTVPSDTGATDVESVGKGGSRISIDRSNRELFNAQLTENVAALKVQVRWLHVQARAMIGQANEEEGQMEMLVPGLYYPRRDAKWKKVATVTSFAHPHMAFRGGTPPPTTNTPAATNHHNSRYGEGKSPGTPVRDPRNPDHGWSDGSFVRPQTQRGGAANATTLGMEETSEDHRPAQMREPSLLSGAAVPAGAAPCSDSSNSSLGATLARMQAQLDKLVQAEQHRREHLAEAVEQAVAKALAGREGR